MSPSLFGAVKSAHSPSDESSYIAWPSGESRSRVLTLPALGRRRVYDSEQTTIRFDKRLVGWGRSHFQNVVAKN